MLVTGKIAAEGPAAESVPARLRLTLAIADRLLVRRHEAQWGLDELGFMAESDMRLRKDEVQCFVETYRELVADTGFIDFEPEGGELVAQGSANRAGVARSAPRRQALLSRLEDLQKKAPMRDAIQDVLATWRQWVRPQRPLLVSRRPDDLKQVIEVLFGLGFSRGELRLRITPSWCRQHGEVTINGLVPERDDAVRFSRGPDGVAVVEAGVEVVGRLEDALVSNADLHRALSVACACNG